MFHVTGVHSKVVSSTISVVICEQRADILRRKTNVRSVKHSRQIEICFRDNMEVPLPSQLGVTLVIDIIVAGE